MKNSILIIILIGLFSFSFLAQINTTAGKGEKIKIELNGLSDEHPNKETMEWFLNNYAEEFIESNESWDVLVHQKLIQKGYEFRTKSSNISLILIFCKNQKDALLIAEANFPVVNGVKKAGVNGGVLFVVEGEDEYKVNDVLGWFAGEE